MILLDFTKPLIFMDLGGFVNKLQTSSKIKVTGQRTLLSKSSFVTSPYWIDRGQAYQNPRLPRQAQAFATYWMDSRYAPCLAFGKGGKSIKKNSNWVFFEESIHHAAHLHQRCARCERFARRSERKENDFKSISNLSTERKPAMDFNLSPSVYNKKIYTSYSKLSEVKLLTIGIASPLRILQWAEKTLPNGKIYGEVLNANTLHHKTFKPQKGGLFCERIFGPLKDFECACGKIDKSIKYDLRSLRVGAPSVQSNRANQAIEESESPIGQTIQGNKTVNSKPVLRPSVKNRKYCPECDVEYTWSVIRRYQLGYIKLNSPVTHVWFLKGTPSYLSILLDFKKRHLQNVTYCSETLTVENALFQKNKLMLLDSPSKIFTTWQSVVNKSTLPSSTSVPSGGSIQKPLGKATLEINKESTSQSFQKAQLFDKADSNTQRPSSALSSHLAKGVTMTSSYVQAQEKLRHRRVLHQQLSPPLYSEKGTAPVKKWCQNITSPISHNNFIKQEIGQFPKSEAEKYKEVPYLSEVKKSSQPFLLSGSSFLSNKNTSNTKMLDVKKGSFLLSFLQLSVYYNTSLLKNKNYAFAQLDRTPFGKNVLKKSTFNQKREPKGYQKSSIFEESNSSIFESLIGQSNKVEPPIGWIERTHFLKESNRVSYTPTLKEISQKLPIDLYILSSLERLLHKQALLLSINKTWGTIYKKAYLKAMHKAIKISFLLNISDIQQLALSPESTLALPSPIGLAKGEKGSVQSPIGQSNREKPLEETTRKSIFSSFYKRKKIEAYKTSAQNINLVLKTIKKDFSNHILMALQNLKQPVLALKHTTQIENSNKQTKLKISSEIEQYLILNTEPITKQLSDVFLKCFLAGNFLEKMAFILLDNKKNTVNPIGSLDKDSAILDLKANKYNTKKDSNRASQFQKNCLNLYKNLIRFNKKEKQHVLNSTLAFSPSFAPQGRINKGNAVLSQKEKAQKYVSFDLSKSIKKSDPFFKKTRSVFFTKQSFLTNPSNRGLSPIGLKGLDNKNANRVYNNVYVLSHRERWSSEKDWQLFSLYNSGISEYTDIPIHTYKNRLSLNLGFALGETTAFQLFSGLPSWTSQKSSTPVNPSNRSSHFDRGFTVNYTLSSAFYSGAGIVQQLLNELNFAELKKLDKQNRLLLYQLNKTIFGLKKQAQFFIYDKSLQLELRELCKKRDFLIRRTKLVRKFFRKDSDPSSMVLTVLPVLPPDLRPIVKMGNQIAASDLNRLYQRVIYRNDRLKKFLKDPATSHSYEMKYAQRLLQEAVDNLIQNGKSGVNSEKDSRGRLLKSLSDLLKGKQGRFRQFLLGKRVDYSGRSVIVVGPKLKLYECGIPLEMAKELYLPFLLKSILNKNYARTVIGAKSLIKNNSALAHELLRDIMRVSPVFLNRAPTLHRLGIQAFVPKLVEGRAILLHPLVCSAFNADFDGDQMAVHVPITVEARAEAWKLMLARNNIFSPATGEPLAIPSQDMVLGCYFLTTYPNQNNASPNRARRSGSGLFFNNLYDVLNAYNRQKIHLHALVWVKWLDSIENGSDQEEPIEIRMSSNGHWQEISANYHRFYDSNNILISQYMATTPGRILFNLLIQKILFSSIS